MFCFRQINDLSFRYLLADGSSKPHATGRALRMVNTLLQRCRNRLGRVCAGHWLRRQLRQPLAAVRWQHPAQSTTTAYRDRIFALSNKRLGARYGCLSPCVVLAQDLQRRLAALLGRPRDYPPLTRLSRGPCLCCSITLRKTNPQVTPSYYAYTLAIQFCCLLPSH